MLSDTQMAKQIDVSTVLEEGTGDGDIITALISVDAQALAKLSNGFRPFYDAFYASVKC